MPQVQECCPAFPHIYMVTYLVNFAYGPAAPVCANASSVFACFLTYVVPISCIWSFSESMQSFFVGIKLKLVKKTEQADRSEGAQRVGLLTAFTIKHTKKSVTCRFHFLQSSRCVKSFRFCRYKVRNIFVSGIRVYKMPESSNKEMKDFFCLLDPLSANTMWHRSLIQHQLKNIRQNTAETKR